MLSMRGGESLPALEGRLAGLRLWNDGTGEGLDSRPLTEGVEVELLDALLDPSAPTDNRFNVY